MRTTVWANRIQRVDELAERCVSAGEVLAFYRHVLGFQRTLGDHASRATEPAIPFREQLNLDAALRQLPALLSLVQEKAPSKLAQEAAEMGRTSSQEHRRSLEAYLSTTNAYDPAANRFFARVLLQPMAENLAATHSSPSPDSSSSICPVCADRPQLAVLRPEGDGGKRFLVCCLCATEWEFRRVLCPSCGEVDHLKLPRYSTEEFAAVRVEACDTCHSYLKSVDMTVDGHAVPLVDEVATVPLDMWAMEHGYNKISVNLMGF